MSLPTAVNRLEQEQCRRVQKEMRSQQTLSHTLGQALSRHTINGAAATITDPLACEGHLSLGGRLRIAPSGEGTLLFHELQGKDSRDTSGWALSPSNVFKPVEGDSWAFVQSATASSPFFAVGPSAPSAPAPPSSDARASCAMTPPPLSAPRPSPPLPPADAPSHRHPPTSRRASAPLLGASRRTTDNPAASNAPSGSNIPTADGLLDELLLPFLSFKRVCPSSPCSSSRPRGASPSSPRWSPVDLHSASSNDPAGLLAPCALPLSSSDSAAPAGPRPDDPSQSSTSSPSPRGQALPLPSSPSPATSLVNLCAQVARRGRSSAPRGIGQLLGPAYYELSGADSGGSATDGSRSLSAGGEPPAAAGQLPPVDNEHDLLILSGSATRDDFLQEKSFKKNTNAYRKSTDVKRSLEPSQKPPTSSFAVSSSTSSFLPNSPTSPSTLESAWHAPSASPLDVDSAWLHAMADFPTVPEAPMDASFPATSSCDLDDAFLFTPPSSGTSLSSFRAPPSSLASASPSDVFADIHTRVYTSKEELVTAFMSFSALARTARHEDNPLQRSTPPGSSYSSSSSPQLSATSELASLTSLRTCISARQKAGVGITPKLLSLYYANLLSVKRCREKNARPSKTMQCPAVDGVHAAGRTENYSSEYSGLPSPAAPFKERFGLSLMEFVEFFNNTDPEDLLDHQQLKSLRGLSGSSRNSNASLPSAPPSYARNTAASAIQENPAREPRQKERDHHLHPTLSQAHALQQTPEHQARHLPQSPIQQHSSPYRHPTPTDDGTTQPKIQHFSKTSRRPPHSPEAPPQVLYPASSPYVGSSSGTAFTGGLPPSGKATTGVAKVLARLKKRRTFCTISSRYGSSFRLDG
eukprot:GHVT01090628.1.p1 GENE.GHVT01090628.1~~GHVT01090628.1.p1  ORF type:complete len:866 (+),score=175.01 GHVT01090628.1:924-3521(+)